MTNRQANIELVILTLGKSPMNENVMPENGTKTGEVLICRMAREASLVEMFEEKP